MSDQPDTSNAKLSAADPVDSADGNEETIDYLWAGDPLPESIRATLAVQPDVNEPSPRSPAVENLPLLLQNESAATQGDTWRRHATQVRDGLFILNQLAQEYWTQAREQIAPFTRNTIRNLHAGWNWGRLQWANQWPQVRQHGHAWMEDVYRHAPDYWQQVRARGANLLQRLTRRDG